MRRCICAPFIPAGARRASSPPDAAASGRLDRVGRPGRRPQSRHLLVRLLPTLSLDGLEDLDGPGVTTPGEVERVLAPERLAQDLDDEVARIALVQDPLDDVAER